MKQGKNREASYTENGRQPDKCDKTYIHTCVNILSFRSQLVLSGSFPFQSAAVGACIIITRFATPRSYFLNAIENFRTFTIFDHKHDVQFFKNL